MIKLKNINQNIELEYYLGDWINNINDLNKEFINNKPYPHIVINNFFKENIAKKINETFPNINDFWHLYYNPIEYKYAYDDVLKYPMEIYEIFNLFSTDKFISILKNITNINNLEYDPYLHGAGLHAHPKYGRLHIHLDYEKHPYTGKERRLNLIYFINDEWKEEYNGDLQLWEKNMSKCSKQIYPEFNKVTLFQTNDVSWHGLPIKIDCPENIYRKTLAYYWVSDLCTKKIDTMYRMKAKYVKRPDDVQDDRIQKLYDIRKDRRIIKEDMDSIFPNWDPKDI
jgi:Rps23 Pro-64 3,4-dihydroxylase Tpa1-like proline 4-hydroxylase